MNEIPRSASACAFAAAMLLLSACSAPTNDVIAPDNGPAATVSPAGLQLLPLTIKSANATHRFTVELAETREQQARGLMFRTEMAADHGMLFPFDQVREASFWMKNTVIPLDIIFVRSDGTIESIAANTTPYSLEPVSSGEPVAAVLELNGGRAAQLKIKSGDQISWSHKPKGG